MTDKTTNVETHLQAELGKVLFGLEDVIHALTIGLLARGHVLLEGAPGLARRCSAKPLPKYWAAPSSAFRVRPI